MVKQVYGVSMPDEGQRRLDHYNKWLCDPKRELGTVYPGYPRDKKVRNVKAEPATVKRKPRMSVDKIVDSKSVIVDFKGPRPGSKLSKALEIVKSTGKDDKESCLKAIVEALSVTRGNASIYYAKSLNILG
jgi:hypothetical protein